MYATWFGRVTLSNYFDFIFAGYYSIDDVIGAVIVMKSKLLCDNCWNILLNHWWQERQGLFALANARYIILWPQQETNSKAKMPPLRPPPPIKEQNPNNKINKDEKKKIKGYT